MEQILNSKGKVIVEKIIETILSSADYLSEIDGAIGDGDHGINMRKGMKLCQQRIAGKKPDLTESLTELSQVLMVEIGGAMGPIYGVLFEGMAEKCAGKVQIDAKVFEQMLIQALDRVQSIGNAQQGDKTLVDTLIAAQRSYSQALKSGPSFKQALIAMADGAVVGRDSTIDLVAKLGRASRLGERSRGVLDAGATSCCLILLAITDAITTMLDSPSYS